MPQISRFIFALFTAVIVTGTSACSVVAEPSTITSYEECVAAGNKILRSYPARCVTAEGQSFTEPVARDMPKLDLKETRKLCVDQCGNGQCEMMVCMGEGCPCAENAKSCPNDCE